MATGQAFNTPHRLKIQIRIEYEQKFPVAGILCLQSAGALSEKRTEKELVCAFPKKSLFYSLFCKS